MWRRLLAINISNTAAAAAGFGVNYFLVKLIGLDGFGEFSVLLARLNLLFLFFVLLPQSYAVFKLQDDSNFKHIFFSFNCYINILLALVISFIIKDQLLRWAILLYILTNGLQTYADTVLQSLGNTVLFFRLLLVSALIKFAALGLVYLLDMPVDIHHIWFIIGAGQLVFFYVVFLERRHFKPKLIGLKEVIKYIVVNIKKIKQYYLYVGLKRMQDNSPLLLFDFFLSKESIGLFSLLIKPLIFFVSLVRTLESFLTSRENFAAFHQAFKSRVALISVVLFITFIPFCIVYMYVYTGRFSILECLILSVLIPMFVIGTLIRVEYLASYNQSRLNKSCLIFIVANLLLSTICYFSGVTNVYAILVAYVLSNMVSIGYLISKNEINEKGVL